MFAVPSLLTAFSLLYLGLSPRVNQPLYRPILFYPEPLGTEIADVPRLGDISGVDVYFEGDMGQRLNGWYWRHPDARWVILFSHGNSGNISVRDKLARLMLDAGASVFVYDYQGFGRSTGTPNIARICSDARAAYDYLLAREGVAPESIVLYGESLGAAVASYLSTVRSSGALILQSGFASLQRIATETFPLLRVYPPMLYPKPALDTQSILRRGHPPLLIIHGDLDPVVPVQHAVDLYDAAVGERTFLRLPDTGHADIWSTAAEDFILQLQTFLGAAID